MDHVQVLQTALDVLKDRGAVYGGVEQSFERAAQLASLKLDKVVTPYEIAIVLESVKDARRAVNPFHVDSHVDGINYRAFAAEFMETLYAHLPEEPADTMIGHNSKHAKPEKAKPEKTKPETENTLGQASSP